MVELAGIRLKRRRAWEELNRLSADIDAFIDGRPFRPRVGFDKQRQQLTVHVQVYAQPDPMWSIRIGEIVHNFRSALDHAVWELAGRPSGAGTKTQFPIFITEAGFDKRARPQFLKDVDGASVNLIESEQPFRRDADNGLPEGVASPLWHLKELSDIDKHRTLHLTGASVEEYNVQFPQVAIPFTLEDVERHTGGPIDQDVVLWRGILRGATDWPFAERTLRAEFGVDVAFEEGTPSAGVWGVKGALVRMGNRADHVLRRIAEEILDTDL